MEAASAAEEVGGSATRELFSKCVVEGARRGGNTNAGNGAQQEAQDPASDDKEEGDDEEVEEELETRGHQQHKARQTKPNFTTTTTTTEEAQGVSEQPQEGGFLAEEGEEVDEEGYSSQSQPAPVFRRLVYTSPTAETITVECSDEEVLEIEKSIATRMSVAIRKRLENLGPDASVLHLDNITGRALAKVMEYCYVHTVPDTIHIDLKTWDDRFVRLDPGTLCELASAAYHLEIKPLVDLTCQAIAQLLKGKSPAEIRRTFNILYDFSPEDDAPPPTIRDKLRNKLCNPKRREKPKSNAPEKEPVDTRSVDELVSFINNDSKSGRNKKPAGKAGKRARQRRKKQKKLGQEQKAQQTQNGGTTKSHPGSLRSSRDRDHEKEEEAHNGTSTRRMLSSSAVLPRQSGLDQDSSFKNAASRVRTDDDNHSLQHTTDYVQTTSPHSSPHHSCKKIEQQASPKGSLTSEQQQLQWEDTDSDSSISEEEDEEGGLDNQELLQILGFNPQHPTSSKSIQKLNRTRDHLSGEGDADGNGDGRSSGECSTPVALEEDIWTEEEDLDDMDPELKAQQDKEVEEFRVRLEQINQTTLNRSRISLPTTLSLALIDSLRS
ncbi:Skp1 domain-containing protein [Balamuthia mandrillaris]